MSDALYKEFATLDNCLRAYATCVYRRAYDVGRGEHSGEEVLKERMRVEMACLRAVKSFVSGGGPEPADTATNT